MNEGERVPGLAARRERGPVLRKGVQLPASGWFDPRGRALGSFAFTANRITGLGLVLYLYLHLAVLSQLLAGRDAWNGFLEIAVQPLFLGLDVLLIFGLLYHGLNGIRLALVGSGIAPNRHKALWLAFGVIGTIALAYSALHIVESR